MVTVKFREIELRKAAQVGGIVLSGGDWNGRLRIGECNNGGVGSMLWRLMSLKRKGSGRLN